MNKLISSKHDVMQRPAMNADLISKRYAQEGEKSWGDIVKRVAYHGGGKDAVLNKKFYDAIYSGNFFPSRMTYMGTKHPFASSCFVFPIEDSLVSIMKTLSEACQVQKYGGGTGYNFSHLRPQGDIINTSGGEASGPVSFMGLFHRAMEVVHRAGKKHAAQMGILNCDHPNIYEFIQCKDQEGAFWTFNISVAVTDEFMEAVKNDTDWNLKFGGKVYKTVKAKELWNYIIQHAWFNGDPGIIFIDTVNKNNKYPEKIEACNPCGEQMLPPHVSCNLGSIDLSRFVKGGEIDWDGLKDTVRTAVRFLDGSVANAYWPVKKIQTKTRKYRNIGLGVMGWVDMLILLGIPYDSDKAVKVAEEIMSTIDKTADDESKVIGGGTRVNTTVTSIAPTGSISLLAGCSSGIEPLFGVVTMKNTYVGSYSNVHWIFESIAKERGFYSEDLMKRIADIGSVQNISEVPDDVKSLFKTTGEIDWVWHVKHQAAFQKYTDNAVSKTINLPNEATTKDVEDSYNMAYQTGCKSITVYRDGSRQIQVMDSKRQAREMCPNCNAILFMNDGIKSCVTCGYTPSKIDETENSKEEEGTKKEHSEIKSDIEIKRPRPEVVNGKTYRIRTPYGKAFITLNRNGESGDNPFEVFVTIGKAGSDVSAVAEALGRLISGWLRTSRNPHVSLGEIAGELNGIGGSTSLGFGKDRVRSLPDAISKVLQKELDVVGFDALKTNKIGEPSGQKELEAFNFFRNASTAQEEEYVSVPANNASVCIECGNMTLVYAEGCEKCISCGYSKC